MHSEFHITKQTTDRNVRHSPAGHVSFKNPRVVISCIWKKFQIFQQKYGNWWISVIDAQTKDPLENKNVQLKKCHSSLELPAVLFSNRCTQSTMKQYLHLLKITLSSFENTNFTKCTLKQRGESEYSSIK